MIPLRVTFEVATPWVPPAHGVHLDGLLAWSAAEGCMSHPHHTQAMIDAAINGLPLKRHVSADGQWCWMASLLQPANPGPLQRHLATAKTDTDALAEGLLNGAIIGRKTIDLVRGMTKNDLFRYTSQQVTQIHAWCIGDPETIAILLSRVRSVGGKGSRGYGLIRRNEEGLPDIRISEDSEAWDRWKQRHLPEPIDQMTHVAIEGNCIPPYWHNAAGKQVWRPIDV